MDMAMFALVAVVLVVSVVAAAFALHASRSAVDAAESVRRMEELASAFGREALTRADLERVQEGVQRQESGISLALSATSELKGSVDVLARQVAASQDGLNAVRREMRSDQERTRETVESKLEAIRIDNERQLNQMRDTVNEKLDRTLNDRLSRSFSQVSSQLDAVSQGLGEMRTVAAGVGDLKRVLSNVKTRGTLGEVQLGAILREVLAPDQYLTDVATVPGSANRVEFAVKIPVAEGEPVLMPIDSKFPGDAYEHLRQAQDLGDADAVDRARKLLERQVRNEAKDIHEKYVSVPATTNFGIMFLPFEGLYAEVVDMPGLIETLQRDYGVSVAGPSTMAAILNSLQMSYQTFAFQRRADEIQRVLAAVKSELPKYQAELERAAKQIETAGKTVNKIITTRTNVMERKLGAVTALEDADEAAGLLGFETSLDDEDVEVE